MHDWDKRKVNPRTSQERIHFTAQDEVPSLMEILTGKAVTVDKQDNDRLLIQSLDEVLDDLFGKQVRETFYDYMERNFYFGREEIPKRLGDFLLVLERTFGKSGKTIERTLAKRLCSKLGQD